MNLLKNEINLIGFKISSYRTENTLHVHYRAKLLTFNKIIVILPWAPAILYEGKIQNFWSLKDCNYGALLTALVWKVNNSMTIELSATR